MKQRRCFAVLLLLFAPGLLVADPVRIIAFGDSLTAGYGIEQAQAFPAQLETLLTQAGHEVRVVNAGLSGETTAGGLRRIGWVLQQPVDLFLIALGGNDFLRGLPLDDTEANLRAIIAQVRERHPGATIALLGMRAPPNLGADYADAFGALFPRIAETEGVALFPFLLEDVGGIPELNQADGMHPNAEGAKIIAANLAPFVEGLLKDSASG